MLPQTTQRVSTLSDPPRGVVTPTLDTEVFEPSLRGFTVATEGSVAVEYEDGSTAVLPSRKVGADYGGMIRRFLSVGTSASGILGYR